MEHNFVELDLEALKQLYASTAAQLKNALLEGKPWEEVQEFRFRVTNLEAALYRKVRSASFNPAETPANLEDGPPMQ